MVKVKIQLLTMRANLLHKLESELNTLSLQQQATPWDIQLATKKRKIQDLIYQYVNIERQFNELTTITAN